MKFIYRNWKMDADIFYCTNYKRKNIVHPLGRWWIWKRLYRKSEFFEWLLFGQQSRLQSCGLHSDLTNKSPITQLRHLIKCLPKQNKGFQSTATNTQHDVMPICGDCEGAFIQQFLSQQHLGMKFWSGWNLYQTAVWIKLVPVATVMRSSRIALIISTLLTSLAADPDPETECNTSTNQIAPFIRSLLVQQFPRTLAHFSANTRCVGVQMMQALAVVKDCDDKNAFKLIPYRHRVRTCTHALTYTHYIIQILELKH